MVPGPGTVLDGAVRDARRGSTGNGGKVKDVTRADGTDELGKGAASLGIADCFRRRPGGAVAGEVADGGVTIQLENMGPGIGVVEQDGGGLEEEVLAMAKRAPVSLLTFALMARAVPTSSSPITRANTPGPVARPNSPARFVTPGGTAANGSPNAFSSRAALSPSRWSTPPSPSRIRKSL